MRKYTFTVCDKSNDIFHICYYFFFFTNYIRRCWIDSSDKCERSDARALVYHSKCVYTVHRPLTEVARTFNYDCWLYGAIAAEKAVTLPLKLIDIK